MYWYLALALLPLSLAQNLAPRQTAAPFPPIVCTPLQSTGSVYQSVLQAIGSGNAPADAILTSQASNSLTAQVPPLAPTPPVEDSIKPFDTTSQFAFSSASLRLIESSETLGDVRLTGTIDLNQQQTPARTSRSAAVRLDRPYWPATVAATLVTALMGTFSVKMRV